MSSKERETDRFCRLHFDVDNHTDLNFTNLSIKAVTRDSAGNIVDELALNDRVPPQGHTTMEVPADHCPAVSSIELQHVKSITEIDGTFVSGALEGRVTALPLRWANHVQDITLKSNGGPIPAEVAASPASQETARASSQRNMLESALDPFAPNRKLFDQFRDQGGLNAENSFYGLPVEGVVVQWERSGAYSTAIMNVPGSVSPAQVRTALSAACKAPPAAWTYKIDPWPFGTVRNGAITCTYVGSERSSSLEVSIGREDDSSSGASSSDSANAPTGSSSPTPSAPSAPAVLASTTQPINCAAAAQCAKAMLAAAKSQDLAAAMAAAAAMDALPKPARGDRNTARKLNQQGLLALAAANPDGAVKLFSQATAADPGDQEIIGNLAYAYSAAGDQIKAEDTAVLALSINPRRTSIWAPLA
ncbi:hypothetical protein GNZ12_37350, partial [Paraburkholderia sp. 1N]